VVSFDEIDHDQMLRFLEHRIADPRVLSLIRNGSERA
jgi:retron-type reverse transcriptase